MMTPMTTPSTMPINTATMIPVSFSKKTCTNYKTFHFCIFSMLKFNVFKTATQQFLAIIHSMIGVVRNGKGTNI